MLVAKPPVSHQVIVNLIAATTTKTGLRVRAELDPGKHPKGLRSPTRRSPPSDWSATSFTGNGTTASSRAPFACPIHFVTGTKLQIPRCQDCRTWHRCRLALTTIAHGMPRNCMPQAGAIRSYHVSCVAGMDTPRPRGNRHRFAEGC